jgi:hypothetical protein
MAWCTSKHGIFRLVERKNYWFKNWKMEPRQLPTREQTNLAQDVQQKEGGVACQAWGRAPFLLCCTRTANTLLTSICPAWTNCEY